MMASLGPEQLALLNNERGLPQADLVNALAQDEIMEEDTNNNTSHTFRWDALLIFIMGSFLLFLWAFYCQHFFEILFKNLHQVPEHLQNNFENIIQMAAQAGRLNIVRTFTANRIEALLNDPDTALRAEQALRNVGALRR